MAVPDYRDSVKTAELAFTVDFSVSPFSFQVDVFWIGK